MTRKMAIVLILTLLISLGGCRLARGEQLQETGYDMTDKLIGVFITEEHLNLFDMEAYLNDNLNKIMAGKELSPAEQEKYEGRIYATPEGYLENGNPNGTFIFEGVEGYAFFVPEVEAEGYRSSVSNCDSCFAGLHLSTHVKDNNIREETRESTIYVVDDRGENLFFMNPVYQDENGYVYLMAGTGVSAQDLTGAMSQTITSEFKTSVDGVDTTERYTVKINYQAVPHPKQIVVLQMSGDSAVLHRAEYAPGQLPEQIDPVTGAEYIIVETVNERGVTREIVSGETRWMHTYDPQENGICEQQQTEVLWKDWESEE